MLAEYVPGVALFTVLAVIFAIYIQIAGSTEYSQQNTFSIPNVGLIWHAALLNGMKTHLHAQLTCTYTVCLSTCINC